MTPYDTLELLAPAGEPESLLAALRYGADAVYLGARRYGMRAKAANFDGDELSKAAETCHSYGKKLYLTCNTLPRGQEVDELPEFIRFAQAAGVDALIVADIGVLALAKKVAPELPLHISTQFGVVNHLAAAQLHELGAQRVILARELSLEEIAAIRAKTPPALELEAFVHGAMCVSVSGRCVLSNYMTGRDANRGACAQPCRWDYALMERQRQGEYYPVYEEDGYSFILNANDLCMLGHLDKLAAAGISSFKIEGRAKSAYYAASVVGAYRRAMDHLAAHPDNYSPPEDVLAEVEKISHRPYSTGFYLGDEPKEDFARGGYSRPWQLIATVDGWADGWLFCTERNRFCVGETLEALRPDGPPLPLTVGEMRDGEDQPLEVARHPMMQVKIRCDTPLPEGAMLRRAEADTVTPPDSGG